MALYNMRSFVLALGIAGAVGACDVGSTPATNNPDAPIVAEVDAPIVDTPKVSISVNKATLETEQLATEPLIATITGAGGFNGAVTLTATVVNAATDAPVVGATASAVPASVTLTANGTAMSTITVKLPNNAPAATKVKIAATSSAPAAEAVSAFTVLNQVTLLVKNDGGGACTYAGVPNVEIRSGTMMRFKAADQINNLVIHSNGAGQGVPHQQQNGDNTPDLQQGQVYQKMSGPGVGDFDWYCHTPGPNLNAANPRIRVVAPTP